MDYLEIEPNGALKGNIQISGAKNAALPLMCAGLLSDDTLTLAGWPDLADTHSMRALLQSLNMTTDIDGDTLTLRANGAITPIASYDLVRKMRASILVLGPLLARLGTAKVSLPGGCAIGSRPVDLHIMVMEKLGAHVRLEDGYVLADAKKGLKGNRIIFPNISVGATENALMAASMAKGETTLLNPAREPEIIDLAECLIAMGARIEGHGSACISIQGVDALHGARHKVIPDRIEAGSFAIAAAMTQGNLTLKNARADHLDALLKALTQAGAEIKTDTNSINISMQNRSASGCPKAVNITTEPYPGFPTDLQAQFMTLMCIATGTSQISETIFENRFMHVPELMRMGADIRVSGGTAEVRGVESLTGAPVMATDLRASISLVLAGLVANGRTTVGRVYHLDRGYDRLEEKLNACGARIRRIKD